MRQKDFAGNNSDWVLVNDYAEITYLALFDKYVIEYGGRTYHNVKTGGYSIFYGDKVSFETLKECYEFCENNGLVHIKEYRIDHPLAHGLPDCRAIRDGMHRYL